MKDAAGAGSAARAVWSGTPGAFKSGAVIGVIAWFVAISDYSTTIVNGRMTACSYLDYAKLGLGAIVMILAVTGLLRRRRSRRRWQHWLAAVLAAALIADGVLLVLRGLDLIATVCHS